MQIESIQAEEDLDEDCMDFRKAVEEFFTLQPALTDGDFRTTKLQRICQALPSMCETEILDKLTLYLRETFPVKIKTKTKD